MSTSSRFVAIGLCRGVLLTTVVLALTACPPPSTTDAGIWQDAGQPEADAGTASERCHDRWATLCAAWSTCGDSATYFPTSFSSVEECVALGTRNCEAFVAAAAGAPGLGAEPGFEPARFLRCTAAMAAQESCERVQNYLFGANYRLDSQCLPAAGLLANDAPCIVHDQCQSSFCKVQGGCGVCASLSGVGGSCTVAQECEPGLGCLSGACTPYLEADAVCSASDLCRPGMACINGRCLARLPTGAECVANGPPTCRLGHCKAGRCEDYVVSGKAGGPCGVDVATGTVSVCEKGAACKFITQAYQGLCVARARPGERCFFSESFQGSQCEPFSQCLNGVCTQPGPEPTCGQDGGATPARRDGGVVPPADAGAALVLAVDAQNTLTCDALFACPRYQSLVGSFFGARSNCDAALSRFSARFAQNPFRASSAAEVEACNTALGALSACEMADIAFAGLPPPAGCPPVPGLTPPGGSCEADYQCGVNGHCTVGVLDQACGICAIASGDGGTCAMTPDCTAGLACSNGRCIPAAGLAAACSAAQPCDRGLVCRLGFCAQPGDADAGCNPSGNDCAPGLFCHRTRRSCELALLVGQPDGGALAADGGVAGARCGILGGGLVDCPRGFACKLIDATNVTGECDIARDLGEPCAWSGGLFGRGQCAFPGACNDGVCSLGDETFCQ